MTAGEVDLSRYDNSWFRPGSYRRRVAWYLCSAVCFRSLLPLPSRWKSRILRGFGARIGRGVVIKPRVAVTYPWRLVVGDRAWIGEGAWIDNLDEVRIGHDACLSQAAHLLTGNHDYTSPDFDLVLRPVVVEDGAWVGARALICPGVTVASHSVVAAGSVLTRSTDPYTVYAGNPAAAVRPRRIRASPGSTSRDRC
jgi:putative colanic acid biosynthesis acetyltransferase WcaF